MAGLEQALDNPRDHQRQQHQQHVPDKQGMSCHTLSPDRDPSCTQINHSCASQPLSDGTS